MTTAVMFDIIAKDRASDKFDKVGDSASKSSGKLKKFAAVGVAAVAAGALVAGKALFDMTKGAIEDEKAQKLLATTLKNTTGATGKQVSAVEDWITAQGKALGVADDELRPAMQRLAEATGDVGKAQDLASLAMDISAGTGKSLKTVSEALAKAQMGQVGGLSRYGIATRDASGEMMKFDEVTKKAAKTFGGQASEAANTTEGKFKRLKVQFDEVKETIGAKLIPVAEKLVNWLLNDFIPAAEKFAKVAGPVMKKSIEVLGDTFRDVAKAGKWMWNNVLQPVFSHMLQTLQKVANTGADMLDALSKAPGMGWAEKAADKLRLVAERAGAADRAIRGIPSYKKVTIDVGVKFMMPKGKPPKYVEDVADDPMMGLANPRTLMRVKSDSERVMEAMTSAFSKGGKKLKKLLGDNIESLRDSLKSARDEIRSLSESIASSINQTDFSSLEALTGSLGGNGNNLNALSGVFGQLKGSVSKGFLSSLMQSGNTGLATELGANPELAAQLSAQFETNAAIAKGLADDTAQVVLGDRITAALAAEIGKLLDELKGSPEKQAKKLRKEMETLQLVVRGVEPGMKAHLMGAW